MFPASSVRPGGLILGALFCGLALISCRRTGPPGGAIVIGQTITVPSRHLSKDMIIDVGLPSGYADKKGRYPLLVTCQSNFLHVTGIAADLAAKSGAPDLIVASVRNYSSGDLIPERIDGHPDSGGADRFIAFFRDELIPSLDARFRTHPFRIFYSGSFGGGFAVYMFLTQPAVFNACLSATPAIDYEGGSTMIMDDLRSYLAKNTYQDRFLYMGVENDPLLIPLLDRLAGILREAEPKGAKWDYHPFLDEDHGSIVNRVVYRGLKFVFSDWNKVPDELAGQGVGAVRSYASALAKTYGFEIGLSRSAVAVAAGSCREQGRTEDVVDLLKLGLEYEPDAEMLWLQLGRALESTGRLSEAKQALETARQKAAQSASPHLGIFDDALDEIGRKIRRTP